MSLKSFLITAATIALAVGSWAVFLPATLLASKGVAVTPGTLVWVREVGVLLWAVGLLALSVRNHPPSPTLRAVLLANLGVQLGLASIELLAWLEGTIPDVWGIVPNTILHLVLAGAFARYLRQMPRA